MPQLGLLFMLVAVPMKLLSGSNTPLESMPLVLQYMMQASPATHFVAFAKGILLRGAGIERGLAAVRHRVRAGGAGAGAGAAPLPAHRCGEHHLMRAVALAALAALAACAPVAPDTHVPPFARVPYQPFSRDAVVAIALREWRLFGSPVDDEPPGSYRRPSPETSRSASRACGSVSANTGGWR